MVRDTIFITYCVVMNKDKIIKDILAEYALLVEDGGIGPIDADKLMTAVEKCGYGECFSFDTLLKEIQSPPSVSKNRMSEEDIALFNKMVGTLKRVGNFDDNDLRNADLDYVKNRLPDRFPGDTHNPQGLTYDEMIKKVMDSADSDKPVEMTNCPTSLRIKRGNEKISIIKLPQGLKIDTDGFGKARLYLKLYKELGNKLSSKTTKAAGIEQERIKAEELNKWFQENNSKQLPHKLHMVNEEGKRVDCKVEVTGAVHLSLGRTGKADIAMINGNDQVFWVSFKGGDFKDASTGDKYIDFPQYGGFKGLDTLYLSDSTQVKKVWNSVKGRIVEGIVKNYPNKLLIDPRTTTFDEDNVVVNINGRSAKETLPPSLYTFITGKFRLTFYRFVIDKSMPSKQKYLYLMSKFSGYLDFLDGSPETKEIAGKSIYGKEFKLDKSAPFNLNNCNVLMQTSTPLDISIIPAKKDLHLLIKTGPGGYILFNPNLPLPKDTTDPFTLYKPIMYVRSGTEESIDVYHKDVHYMFLSCRIAVLPWAKKSADAIDLSK